MTKQRDWKKIKYYPVSIPKLLKASMREAAYLIAPVNIGEDYEYFDEVKHLLDIPEPRKSIDEISQELNDKIDTLIQKTRKKFEYSQISAEKGYKYEFDKIYERFEYAKDKGHFPPILKLFNAFDGNILRYDYEGGANWENTSAFTIRTTGSDIGYFELDNDFRVWRKTKPNWLVRTCAKIFLGLTWQDA